MIHNKEIVPKLNRFYSGHFQNTQAMASKDLSNGCKKQNRALQLVLHGAIFFVTSAAVALREKKQVDCSV